MTAQSQKKHWELTVRKLTCRKTILAIFLISALIPITAGAQNFQVLVTFHGYNGAVPHIAATILAS